MEKFVRPRPEFPKYAVVTGGMPYSNKFLHFAHIGLLLRADTFARFMRDRIGKDNVVFVSGTDCYGSPAMETFRKLKEAGETDCKSLSEFVEKMYHIHEETFKEWGVSFNFYGASAFGRSGEIHTELSKEFIFALKDADMLSKQSSWQFYDKKYKCLLNGRQVVGKCPIEGCQSEKGYADECDLGHQYLPQDLIDPISNLSGEKPELVKIENWYFDLDKCSPILTEWIDDIAKRSDTPPFMVKELKEFFKKPEIYIKKEYFAKFEEIKNKLPAYVEAERKPTTPSMTIIFDKLKDRENACEILAENGIRYRTGKTLTPFRLTGDVEWGVPCPEIDGLKDQTFYVWPESLWAPISFVKTYLEKIGKDNDEWKKYWCDDNAEVYQFIGEDNLYFYSAAQQAMWLYTQGKNPMLKAPNGNLHVTRIVPIKSLLLMGNKASSSGSVKPPMAKDLLNYYTPDQYRMHFLGMNLGNNNVSFIPKPFNPDAKPEDADPVLKEGNLLTNVYNRILRTVFYTLQKELNSTLPILQPDEQIKEECTKAILDYERFMYDKKFHQVINVVDVFVRNINKYWVKNVANAQTTQEKQQLIANTMQYIVTANTLLHPLAPVGTEKVCDYLGLNENKAFDWQFIFDDWFTLLKDQQNPKIVELKEKEDFFKKLDYQFN